MFKTEQEDFWATDFGDAYVNRSSGPELIASNVCLFSKALSNLGPIGSVIELGSNIGMNLRALRHLYPNIQLNAVEINQKAVEKLREIPDIQVFHDSILNFEAKSTSDLALIKGVLIHINPEQLAKVYELLYQASHRWILLVEYYNPTPVTVNYRGHDNRLFKRDFAGEMLDRYPDLALRDYGFIYHRAQPLGRDDLNWFLLEKSAVKVG
ncbi:MAG: pseudaminic acid biosynthesis-associated methylase [Candidatus Sericytochromatia bacterium]